MINLLMSTTRHLNFIINCALTLMTSHPQTALLLATDSEPEVIAEHTDECSGVEDWARFNAEWFFPLEDNGIQDMKQNRREHNWNRFSCPILAY